MSMFCYQCEEAAKGTGCTMRGVCGKTADVSNLQDLLIYVAKGIGVLHTELRALDRNQDAADKFVMEALFATITNANFDDAYFKEQIRAGIALRDGIRSQLEALGWKAPKNLQDAAVWSPKETSLDRKAAAVGVLSTQDEDIRSLRELTLYGLKGLAAYMAHAYVLGYQMEELFAFMQRALAATLDDSLGAEELTALTLETGRMGVAGMELLDMANTETYGHPEITKVNIGVGHRPGILISGHDLKDMEALLKQTEGTGVDVYTHGEMLPAHYYPAFKKYKHFAGNYGNAWWRQDKEFKSFNGPILMTTNCLVPPKAAYIDRVYTTGVAGFPGVTHIPTSADGSEKDFSKIIAHAKTCPTPKEIERGEIVGGFAHHTVLSLADQVVEAVKSGAVRKFFVMAGCDGRKKGRDYYTEFAEMLPQDAIILTAGCAKYRYNKLNLGDIGGIPRVLDAGQCNDSYSLAIIALKLKEAFGLEDINELPIAYNIAWYEQKAVIVLLALLYMGVKNIHLGPSLPAFLSPNVAKVLVEQFSIAGIGSVEDDLAMFLK